MPCPCKNKPQPIEEHVGMDLIRRYGVGNEILPTSDRNILYKFYDEQFNQTTPTRCITCWEDYIKQKLVTLWMEKQTTEEPQK